MSLESDLASAEWKARRARYVALGVLLAATAAASYLVLSVVNGLEEGIGREISETLGGDLRIARGRAGVSDGHPMHDLSDVLQGLRFIDPSASYSPRLETQAIFLQESDFTSSRLNDPSTRAAAVLVGLDPAADRNVVPLDSLIVRGRGLAALEEEILDPDGFRLVPIIVGATFLETGNATVSDGTFTWDAVYNFTAGNVENGRIVRERGIVVGAYETGFRMVDHLVVYAPRGDVARLLGFFPTDPPANVILAKTRDAATLEAKARERGFNASGAPEFRESYLGPVFGNVRAAAWSIVGLLSAMTAGWMGYTLAHHVHEDRRKIATLRAVGIPDRTIGRTYLILAAVLSASAALAGILAAVVVSIAANIFAGDSLLIAPVPSPLEGLFLIVLSVVAGLLTVQWALRRAARVSIRDALQAP